jgi:hypothetical protein
VWTVQHDGTIRINGLCLDGKCLDDPAASTTNGTQLDIYTCTSGAANEAWQQPTPAAATSAATGQ